MKSSKMNKADINTTADITEIIRESDIIFICVKPLEINNILKDIKPFVNKNKHIVSLAGTLLIEDMERIVDCKITKMMPTVISEVNKGITLICHNNKVTLKDMEYLEKLFGSFTTLKKSEEDGYGFAAELTSCGPGFYAAIFQEFVEAGIRHTDIFTKEEISQMVLQTVYGTVRLMLEQYMDFSDVVNRVATKGGITEEGVKIIQERLPYTFDEVFCKTLEKRKIVTDKIHKQLIDDLYFLYKNDDIKI